ncbi:hypothetical protein NGY2020029_29490 [Vibrio cholerae]
MSIIYKLTMKNCYEYYICCIGNESDLGSIKRYEIKLIKLSFIYSKQYLRVVVGNFDNLAERE